MKTCKYCGTQINDSHYRVICKSHECRKAYARDYYHDKVKKAYTPPNISRKDEERRELELKGLLPISGEGGLYEGCTEKQIHDMKTNNFKEFMR